MSTITVSQNNNLSINPGSGDQTRQFLTFQLGQEIFGVDILDVKEIIEICNITRVPLTPAYIRGVINLRGNVVSIIDLSARLDRKPSTISKRSSIVILTVEHTSADQMETATYTLGMLVDEVNEILDISQDSILPAPDFGAEIRTEFIQSMGRVDNKFIILLAINRILSVTELSQLQQSTTPLAQLATSNSYKLESASIQN